MDLPQFYAPGIILPLTSHRPPEPFGKNDYKHPQTPGVETLERDDVQHLSYDGMTFSRHPRERHEPSIFPMPTWFTDKQTAKIMVDFPLSTSNCGAQVMVCSVVGPDKVAWKKMQQDCPKQVVAKIFDPAYYYDTSDPVGTADREYSQEAAAYFRMHDERLAKNPAYMEKPDLVPGFYGTWTTDITLDHFRKPLVSAAKRKKIKKKEASARKKFEASKIATSATSDDPSGLNKHVVHTFRPVRIILLESIEGSTVTQLCVKELDGSCDAILRPMEPYDCEKRRLAIFHSIMDTDSRIGHFGITHFKRYPTSFIVKESDDRVVITDFSESDTWSYVDVGFHIQERLPKPLHPLALCDIDQWSEFRGWFPAEWLDDPSVYDIWGEATFAHDQYADEATVDKALEELDWVNTLKKSGRLPSYPGDPTYKDEPTTMFPGIDEEQEEKWRLQAIAMGIIPPDFKIPDTIHAPK